MTSRSTSLPKSDARRNRGLEAASKLVALQVRGPATKRGFAEAKLLTRWPEIAGEELAQTATPLSLSYRGAKGLGATLVLLCRGSDAPLVQMREAEIVARVNACYGYRAVARIHITQTSPRGLAEEQTEFRGGPKAPVNPPDAKALAEAETKLAHVGDDRLRAALGRLAGHVLREKR